MFWNKNKYPEEVRIALAQILSTAILSLRFNARQGNLKYCDIESDHIHNLPSLIERYDRDKLRYYLQSTREEYVGKLKQLNAGNPSVYEEQWRVLEKYI